MKATGFMASLLQIQDLYRASAPVLDFVMNKLSLTDPLSAMENIVSELGDEKFISKQGENMFNAYPINLNNNKCYPYFLGICRGIDTLDDVWEVIQNWAKKADKNFPVSTDKISILLTDKWNDSFDAYEQNFRYLTMRKGFFFMNFLATQNGIAEIPFIPAELFSFTRFEK